MNPRQLVDAHNQGAGRRCSGRYPRHHVFVTQREMVAYVRSTLLARVEGTQEPFA